MRSFRLNQRGSVATDWIVAITAVAAIIISLFTLYKTYYRPNPPPPPKPFQATVSLGSPMLHDRLGFLSIILSVPLTNNGDEPGCISDIALTLQSKTLRTQWSYFPAWKISMQRYLEANKNKQDPSQAFEGPLSPVELPGKGTREQVLLFVPRGASSLKLQPLRAQNLSPGETYVLSVFLLPGNTKCETSTGSKYELFTSKEFVLEKHHIDDLKNGFAIFPVDVTSDSLRETFVGMPK